MKVLEWAFDNIGTFHNATKEQKDALTRLMNIAIAYEKQLNNKEGEGKHESSEPISSTDNSEVVPRG